MVTPVAVASPAADDSKYAVSRQQRSDINYSHGLRSLSASKMAPKKKKKPCRRRQRRCPPSPLKPHHHSGTSTRRTPPPPTSQSQQLQATPYPPPPPPSRKQSPPRLPPPQRNFCNTGPTTTKFFSGRRINSTTSGIRPCYGPRAFSSSDCCSFCQSNPGCVAWSFTKAIDCRAQGIPDVPSTGACYLLAEYTGGYDTDPAFVYTSGRAF